MENIIPKRLHRRGVKPGITSKELTATIRTRKKNKDEEIENSTQQEEQQKDKKQETKWTDEGREYTKEEKRKIIGKVLEVGVRLILENHGINSTM